MENLLQQIKLVLVDANMFESVGYVDVTRRLYIKFRSTPTLCFEKVPRFRYSGLISAPRKDAYYNTFIKNQFLSKAIELPPPM